MDSSAEKLYLHGRLCNGKGKRITEYTKQDLLYIAKINQIPIPKRTIKKNICAILIQHGVVSQYSIPPPSNLSSIEELMRQLDVDDARNLINMTEAELEEIISRIKMYDGKITMLEFLQGKTGSERAKAFLVSMAEKYCRCLKGVESKKSSSEISPNAICSKSIFNSKGLKGPGSSYQCKPKALLLAPKGKKFVLEKK